jgi:hypothetical protein
MGQSNYAAANAALDSLAASRRACGLPATSLQPGAVTEVGMGVRTRADELLARRGLGAVPPDLLLRALAAALDGDVEHVAVVPVADWRVYLRTRPSSARFAELAAAAEVEAAAAGPVAPASSAAGGQADGAGASDPTVVVLACASELAGRAVLPSETFGEAGLDSLALLELRQMLRNRLGVGVCAVTLFDSPTSEALGEALRLKLGVPAKLAAGAGGGAALPSPLSEPASAVTQQLGTPGQSGYGRVEIIGYSVRLPGCIRSLDQHVESLLRQTAPLSVLTPPLYLVRCGCLAAFARSMTRGLPFPAKNLSGSATRRAAAGTRQRGGPTPSSARPRPMPTREAPPSQSPSPPSSTRGLPSPPPSPPPSQSPSPPPSTRSLSRTRRQV